ncbi:MAG TPA: OmpA family protein [Myxococcales bacterium]
MSLRGKPKSPAEGDEADANPLQDATWLYSYADLMTQLLLFSILMLTALGLKSPEPRPDVPPPPPDALAATVKELDKIIKEGDLKDVMVIDKGSDRVVVRMKSQLLFAPGQAQLEQKATNVLTNIATAIARIPNQVRVEGHTDDTPIATAAFPSNWELSSARAISVVRYLEDRGVAKERLSVAGCGEFHPIAPNDAPASRAMNRRVEIVLLGGER